MHQLHRLALLTGVEVTPAVEDLSVDVIANDNRPLYLIISMVAVLLIIIPILIVLDKRKKNAWGSKHINNKKISIRFYPLVYRFLMSYPLTRNYMEKLAYRHRMISPCDSKVIARRTVNACIISWGLCVVAFVFIYMNNPRMSTLITLTATILIINAEVLGRMAKGFEISVNYDIQKLILSIQHNFFVEYRVDDAIYRSRDVLSLNMKAVSDQIYQLLLSEDKDEALRVYSENIPNKYLRALVSQCVGVMERGDQEVEGKCLFTTNLEKLYQEIDIEIEKIQKLNLEFLGVIAVVVAPIFCIDFIKKFAVNIKENMYGFYYGKEGFLLDIGLIIIISIIYIIMRKSAEYTTFYQSKHQLLYKLDRIPIVKRAMDNYCDKNATKQERLKRELRNYGSNMRSRHFVIQSMLIAILVFLVSIVMLFYLHDLSRKQLLVAERVDVELLTSAAKESHYAKMEEVIESYTSKYVLQRQEEKTAVIPETVEEMTEVLTIDGTFVNKLINKALSEDILRRVNKYQTEYFSFIDLSICMLLCLVAYHIPKGMLRYSASVSKDAMEDEVNQFNALICMLMYDESMTVKEILKELESFATVYKQSLRICINDYGAGDMTALLELKEREPYEPFNRIIDNLIRCDAMPISQAFHEVDVERDGYILKRKMANDKTRKKRVLRAYLLAAVPFMLLLAYGIVPPLVASMNEINTILKELESTSW